MKTGKRAFLAGVFWLTLSSVLVKIAGLLFKIPMNYVVGDTGMGYYGSAYSVYTFLYMLSTSGLPVALSVMVSERRSRGERQSARRAYRTALALFVFLGLCGSAVMLFCARPLAGLIKSDDSALAIAVSSPTMLFICVSSALRGYFQGCGNMIPTAVSQLIEAVGKLVFGVGAAMYAVRAGYAIHVVAAYAVSGLTLGSLCGMIYLAAAKLIRGERDLMSDACPCVDKTAGIKETLSTLIIKSLPVTVSASVMSLSSVIDTALIQRMLRSSGVSPEGAAALYGNYTSLAVPMFNLPPVLVYPIAYSIVPVVAALFAAGEREKAADRIANAMRYAVLIGLPCSLGLTVLADPILSLIYKAESAHVASPLLTVLAPSSFFVCVLAVTNSVLQACGHERAPVISMLCGAAVKCAAGVLLLKRFGIMGAPISTFACYLTVTVINFAFVVKYTHIRLPLARTFLKPLFAGVLCSCTAVLVYRLAERYMSGAAACVMAILCAAAVYAAVIIVSGAVGREEINGIIKIKHKGTLKNET